MKVEDGIAELTAQEYIELLCRVLEGEDFKLKTFDHATNNPDDERVVRTQWGVSTSADCGSIIRDARSSNEVQARLQRLLDTTPSGEVVDRLNEKAGDEACLYEKMALDADDELAKVRRQGIATGLRIAQAMALKIHNGY